MSDHEELRKAAEAAHEWWYSTPYWECSYYRRGEPGADPNGTCSFGCVDEPECKTCGPWTPEDREGYAEAMSNWQGIGPEHLLDLLDERDALAARLDAVRELHQRVAPEVACIHCGRRWPCPTIRALDNREDPR